MRGKRLVAKVQRCFPQKVSRSNRQERRKVSARKETGKTRKHRTEKGKREKSMLARRREPWAFIRLPENVEPPSADLLSFFYSSISSTSSSSSSLLLVDTVGSLMCTPLPSLREESHDEETEKSTEMNARPNLGCPMTRLNLSVVYRRYFKKTSNFFIFYIYIQKLDH